MDWSGIDIRIHWTRSRRRRWPGMRQVSLGYEERRKHCNVLLYWWAGRGERQLPGGTVAIGAGDCHWARPGWTYACRQVPDDPLGVIAVHFDLVGEKGMVIVPDELPLPPEQLQVRNRDLVEAVMQHVGDVVMTLRGGGRVEAAELDAVAAMFKGLLMRLDHDTPKESDNKAEDRQREQFKTITAYIHEHAAQVQSVSQLAERFGYSRSHFCRLFTREVGVNPQSYIINARVALAAELLMQSWLSITEIAAQTGYPSLYRFSRQFKQVMGLNPSQYRVDNWQEKEEG